MLVNEMDGLGILKECQLFVKCQRNVFVFSKKKKKNFSSFSSFQVKFLRAYASTSRSKVSQVLDNLIEYTETFVDFDPILFGVLPSNPWITDDQTYWLHNQPL